MPIINTLKPGNMYTACHATAAASAE